MPPATWRIERRLAPSLAAVDEVCAAVRNRLKETATAADSFAVELLLREALVNAVKHGCRDRPDGKVRCEVRRQQEGIRMAIGDDGPGFDWRQRQQMDLPDLDTSGRGVALFTVYADTVDFNDAGNEVVLYRRLGEPHQEIEDDRLCDHQ